MADVTLAEVGGQAWLVKGDEHVDGLLANNLPPTVSVEFVACATRADAWAIWHATSPEAEQGGMPWMIHPEVVRRIKGAFGGASCIRFTPWSAMLTDDAREAITAAAALLAADGTARLTLRQFRPAEPPPGLLDLQRLRGQLVIAALAAAGADTARLDTDTGPTDTPEDCERLDLVCATATGITEG